MENKKQKTEEIKCHTTKRKKADGYMLEKALEMMELKKCILELQEDQLRKDGENI